MHCLVARSSLTAALFSVVVLGTTTRLWSQEDLGASAPQATKPFEECLAEWQAIDAELQSKAANFASTDDITLQDAYRREYADLIMKANKVVNELREAALVKLETDGLKNDVVKTLMGVLVDDARNGRDAQVLRAADRLIPLKINRRNWELAATSPSLNLPIRGKEIFEEILIRQSEAQQDNLPRAKINTSQGEIVVELYENEAPNTVANFISLAKSGYYSEVDFHRVIDGFMAQTGINQKDGPSGPGYTIEDECRTPGYRLHFSGVLSMAKTNDPDSGNSQFFITFNRSQNVQNLDGKHTVFGRVLSGHEVLEKLTRTHLAFQDQLIPDAVPDKINSVEIVRDRGHEYSVKKIPDPRAKTSDNDAAPKPGDIKDDPALGSEGNL
jgi:cyclophilin family peptidyl-prolyl cis-trans isomerase